MVQVDWDYFKNKPNQFERCFQDEPAKQLDYIYQIVTRNMEYKIVMKNVDSHNITRCLFVKVSSLLRLPTSVSMMNILTTYQPYCLFPKAIYHQE